MPVLIGFACLLGNAFQPLHPMSTDGVECDIPASVASLSNVEYGK